MSRITKRGVGAVAVTQSKTALLRYTAILLGAVLFFILMSYLMQERNNSQIASLHAENITSKQKIENLQNENLAYRAQTEGQKAAISENERKIQELEAQLDKLRRDWAADTKALEDSFKSDYNELLQKYNALTAADGGDESET